MPPGLRPEAVRIAALSLLLDALSVPAENVFEGLAAHGQTVIMVTHEADIAAHARRVVVLRDGVIASDDRRATFVQKVGLPV